MPDAPQSTVPQVSEPTDFILLGFVSGAWRRMPVEMAGSFAFHKVVTSSGGLTLASATHPPGTLIRFTNTAAATLYIPQDSTYDFPVGGSIRIIRTVTGSGGQITVEAGAGNTVRFGGANRDNLNGQWAMGQLIKLAANEWVFIGDTSST